MVASWRLHTKRGRYNLTSYIPELFVCPDLGPKMYGCACFFHITHLKCHQCEPFPISLSFSGSSPVVDVAPILSTSLSMLEYLRMEKEKILLKAVDKTGCDISTEKRVRERQS